MQKTFEFEKVLGCEAGRAWDVLSRLDAVAEWAPMIAECRVEGSGPGAVRHCVTADGGKLKEKILSIDVATRTLHYSVEEGLPVDAYTGRFAIVERDGETLVRWFIEARGEREPLAHVEAMLAQVAPAMLDGLDAAARGG